MCQINKVQNNMYMYMFTKNKQNKLRHEEEADKRKKLLIKYAFCFPIFYF